MKDLKNCIGGTFEIIGDHPNKGKKVKAIQVDQIKGCLSHGLLVEDTKSDLKFRVFDINELKPI